MDLTGKRVLVFGAGISGIGSAKLLESVGAQPVIFDGNEKLTPADVLSRLSAGTKAEVVIGALKEEQLSGIDLAVLSPGVPTDISQVEMIKKAQIPVWGEVELAYQCGKGDVLAITGTNGKTTTTTLVGEIMKYHLEKGTDPKISNVHVVGNIGVPYTGVAKELDQHSVAVAEISSFQLETIADFHPAVSAITNITPDHLNRHHTMEEYIRVKERICENQTQADTCVLNYEDPVLRAFGEKLQKSFSERCEDGKCGQMSGCPAVCFFSSARELQEGWFLRDGRIICRENGVETDLLSTKELHLPGMHNYENVMTAAAMTHAFGVSFREIVHVLRLFTAVEHRIEYVAEKNGIVYYNDSKGTNPDAAIKGIQAMDRPTVLIGGGYDKNSSYEEWIRAFNGKVRALVLVGQTKEKIAAAARSCGFEDIVMADTFEEAFADCVHIAQPGDAVLLSPACASWGMFPNYEVRGKVFKDLVYALPDHGEDGAAKR